MHLLLNGVYLLPQTPLWQSGSLQGELVYQRLDKVTKNAAVYYAEDYACTKGYAMNPAIKGRNKSDGCATKDSLSLAMGFTPQWSQVFPGLDLSMPTSFSYGLMGNSPAIGGSFEGAWKYSIGVKATYQNKYDFTLSYADAHFDYKTNSSGLATTAAGASSSAGVVNNKGWLSLMFKTSF